MTARLGHSFPATAGAEPRSPSTPTPGPADYDPVLDPVYENPMKARWKNLEDVGSARKRFVCL